MLNLNDNNMKNLRIYFIAIMIVISGGVFGQSYSFKVQDCGWFVVYNNRNPLMTFDKCFQNDNSIDYMLTEPNGSLYEIDLDSMVFKTNGVITSRIMEVFPESGFIVAIRFQFLATETEGYAALQRRSDGKVGHCVLYMDESKPYVDGVMAIGELKENVRRINK
jgi:hypothetical protein